MVRFIFLGLVMAALATGCSKKPGAAPEADATPAEKPVKGPADPIVQAGIEDINKKLEASQYDAAIGALVSLNGMPKTDEQQHAYMNQVRKTEEMLRQRVAAGDQKAWESQQILGRMMTGR